MISAAEAYRLAAAGEFGMQSFLNNVAATIADVATRGDLKLEIAFNDNTSEKFIDKCQEILKSWGYQVTQKTLACKEVNEYGEVQEWDAPGLLISWAWASEGVQ